MNKHTVALVDDHGSVREGLKTVLARSGRFTVVGEYRTAAAALQHVAGRDPDIVIVDLSLPDTCGTEQLARLKAAVPRARLVVLTMHDRADYVIEAVRAGVDGYVTKQTDPRILVDALSLVVQDQPFFDRPTIKHLLALAERSAAVHVEASSESYGLLTQREQQVFRLLAEGVSTKEIGGRLGISHRTAENHRSSMLRKLGLHSMVELVRYAQQIGVVE